MGKVIKLNQEHIKRLKEYKTVPVLQLEAIEQFERDRAADRESIICNLIGMASLISIIFILANFISNN
jgi:hypothetical protein